MISLVQELPFPTVFDVEPVYIYWKFHSQNQCHQYFKWVFMIKSRLSIRALSRGTNRLLFFRPPTTTLPPFDSLSICVYRTCWWYRLSSPSTVLPLPQKAMASTSSQPGFLPRIVWLHRCCLVKVAVTAGGGTVNVGVSVSFNESKWQC